MKMPVLFIGHGSPENIVLKNSLTQPMIFAIALQDKDDTLEFVYEGFQNRSVSMRCFKIG